MEVLEIGEQQPERRVVRRELPISCVLVVIGEFFVAFRLRLVGFVALLLLRILIVWI